MEAPAFLRPSPAYLLPPYTCRFTVPRERSATAVPSRSRAETRQLTCPYGSPSAVALAADSASAAERRLRRARPPILAAASVPAAECRLRRARPPLLGATTIGRRHRLHCRVLHLLESGLGIQEEEVYKIQCSLVSMVSRTTEQLINSGKDFIMANDQELLKELLESSLSQVEDYAGSIRETAVENLAPDNIQGVYQMNSALLCIEELALQLERLVLLYKDKLKHIVPEPTEQSGDDDVDADDVVPFDWSLPRTLFT